MQELIASGDNPVQTDSVEGMVESIFFKGEMNVCITSTWCNERMTQVPALITILMNKHTKSYGIHWKVYKIIWHSLESMAFIGKFIVLLSSLVYLKFSE